MFYNYYKHKKYWFFDLAFFLSHYNDQKRTFFELNQKKTTRTHKNVCTCTNIILCTIYMKVLLNLSVAKNTLV